MNSNSNVGHDDHKGNVENHGHENNDKKDKDVCLIISTTQDPEPWKATFSKTSKVSDVIAAIVLKYGFASPGNYELRLDANPRESLKPERPLVSYGISEVCQEAVFTDLGGAA